MDILPSRKRVPIMIEDYRRHLKKLLSLHNIDYVSKRIEKTKQLIEVILKSEITAEELGKVAYQAELDFDDPPIKRKWEELSEENQEQYKEIASVLYNYILNKELG